MGRRTFKPLPQTVQESPGQRYQVQWQVALMIQGPEIRNRWDCVPMPAVAGEPYRVATNLTKREADDVMDYWKARPGCKVFEFRIIAV
jgi:hypothetical protein